MSSHIGVTVQSAERVTVTVPARSMGNVTVPDEDIAAAQPDFDGEEHGVTEVQHTRLIIDDASVQVSLPGWVIKTGDIETPLNRVFAQESPPLYPHQGDVWIDIRERP